MVCKNCNHEFSGKYCNYCGQSADTHPINLHFIWHDIQHGLFHYDKGIIYTTKELFTRPGHSIREFINGKRAKHFKPISMIIVLATFYGLLYHYFDINVFVSNDYSSNELPSKINHWMTNHYSWATLATIPLFALGTLICFRKQDYNYFEYLILNTFKASQRLVLHIITFPLLVYFNESASLKTFLYVLYIIDIIVNFWANIQFFSNLSKTRVILLSILSHIIMIFSLLIVLSVISLLLN